MRLRRPPALLLTASVVATVAAVGAAPAVAADPAVQTPEAVLQDVVRDLGQVQSYRFTGTVRDPSGTSRVSGDSTNTGRSRLTMKQGRQVSQMILLPSRAYWKFNAAFLRANFDKSSVKKRASRWLSTSVSNAGELGSGIAESDPKRLASCIANRTGTLSHGGSATVGGQAAIVIVDQGDLPGTTPRKIYLAAAGPTLPLRIVQTGKRKPGGKPDTRCRGKDDDTTRSDLRFTRFNAKLKIVAPKKSIRF